MTRLRGPLLSFEDSRRAMREMRRLRKEAGLGSGRAAARLGQDDSWWSAREKGTVRISAAEVPLIEEALRVLPGTLLGGDQVSEPPPFELWQQADGNPEEYRRLMREAGHLVPGEPEPLPCGWPPLTPDLPVPPVSPAGGTGAEPAEPASPPGEAGSAHGGAVPRGPGPGAHAALPSPSTPEGRAAPGPGGAGRSASSVPPVVARFTVDGEPAAKERPRVTARGTYTPDRTQAAEQVIGWMFRRAAPRHRPDPAAEYGVTALFLCGTRRRRDVDNMLKLVLDGLNKVAWLDDAQVTEVSARKVLSPAQARTEVTVYEITGEAA